VDLDDGAVVVVAAPDRGQEGVVAVGVRATDPASAGRTLRAAGIRVDLVP
jgi:hypothetical protein